MEKCRVLFHKRDRSRKEFSSLQSQHAHFSCVRVSFAQDFSNDDTRLEYNVDTDNGIAMEGYLFKRASNAFKTWNRFV